MALTEKMKAFCREYVANAGNATQAYLSAYDSNSSVSAAIEASRLLERGELQEYITSLRKPLEDAAVQSAIMDREWKKQLIKDRLAVCKAKEDDTAIARYLDILNKMDMEYININRNIDTTDAAIINLDTSTLKKLSGVS